MKEQDRQETGNQHIKSKKQQRISNLIICSPQPHQSLYRTDKMNSYMKFDIKGVIKLQVLQQKRQRLMRTYTTSKTSRSFDLGSRKNDKLDMIIPSFNAIDITPNIVADFTDDKKWSTNPSKQLKSTKYRRRSSVIGYLRKQKGEQQPKQILAYLREQALSKQVYASTHRQDRNSSQAKFRARNIQNIIRRNTSVSFTQMMIEYCKRMKTDPSTRIFIFQSSDGWMKQALLQKGYFLNTDPLSKFYHFKWSTRICNQKCSPNQLINHFYQSDLLTSKEGLAKMVPRSAFLTRHCPRSFDFGSELKQFTANFNQTQILCGLKKIIIQIQKHKKVPSNPIPYHFLKQQFQSLKLTQDFEQENEQSNLIVHLPYAVQLCGFCENIRCGFSHEQKSKQNRLDDKSVKNLFNFALLDPPYEQYRSRNDKYQQIKFEPTNINLYSSNNSFRTPSQHLIALLYGYHLYLCQFLNTYRAEGVRNVWIVKSRNSSRGTGISLSSHLHELTKKTDNRLVQKYIEQSMTQQFGEKIIKFDLRVWVLVTSFKPLIAYYYKHFYCRLSSKPYNLSKLNCLQSHLTNYSKNKSQFVDGADKSIMTYDQFISLVAQSKKMPIPEAQTAVRMKLERLIYETLVIYQGQIRSRPQCFELYGFDVLVSNSLDMFLLEVNLSPACQDRNQWLSNKVRLMAQGLLSIVVDNAKPSESQDLGWTIVSAINNT